MRIDKYDPIDGGFRAPLAADWAPGDLETAFGVGLDANGRVVKGAGNTGIKGVLVLTKALKAGKVVDVMTDGEIVDAPGTFTAGTNYFADGVTGALIAGTGTATLTAPATANSKLVGSTVEKERVVVRVAR